MELQTGAEKFEKIGLETIKHFFGQCQRHNCELKV